MAVLRIKKAIKYGFSAFFSNLKILSIIGLITTGAYYAALFVLSLIAPVCLPEKYGMISCSQSGIADVLGNWFRHIWTAGVNLPGLFLFLFAIAIFTFFGIWLLCVNVNVSLKIRDTGTAALEDLYSFVYQMPKLLLAGVLVALVFMLGLIALIIPGMYWLARSGFIFFIIFDKNTQVIESIKKSFAITKGNVLRIIGLIFVMSVINGLLVFSGAILNTLCFRLFYILQGCQILSAIVIWAVGIIGILVHADAYRQLSPKK